MNENEQIKANRGLVWKVVARYLSNPQEKDDLFQIGCIGLLKAVRTYDPDQSIQFSTYAYNCIRYELFTHFRNEKAQKRVPANVTVSFDEIIDAVEVSHSVPTKNYGFYDWLNDTSDKPGDQLIAKELYDKMCEYYPEWVSRLAEGYSMYDLAKEWNINHNALYEKRKRLKKKLKDQGWLEYA